MPMDKTYFRDGWVDIIKLVGSIIIMLFHFRPDYSIKFYSGALFVELFFSLTGYYAFSYLNKHETDGSIKKYLKKFYINCFPHLLIGLIFFLLFWLSTGQNDIVNYLKIFYKFVLDLLLLHCTGIYSSSSYVFWYLSITMICLPLVMAIYKYVCKSNAMIYVSIYLPILFHGFLVRTNGTIRVNDLYINVIIRTMAGLFLGAFIQTVSNHISAKTDDSKKTRTLLTAIEVSLLLISVYLMTKKSLAKTPYDIAIVYMLISSLCLHFSNKTLTSRFKTNNKFLAEFSISIYCLHWGIYKWLEMFNFSNWNTYIYLGHIFVLLVSFFSLFLAQPIRKFISKFLF